MRAEAVGGPIFTRTYKALLAIGILGVLITIWRFFVGLGASTALSDGYPLGIWIAFDVVTGTALACGGYAAFSSSPPAILLVVTPAILNVAPHCPPRPVAPPPA